MKVEVKEGEAEIRGRERKLSNGRKVNMRVGEKISKRGGTKN